MNLFNLYGFKKLDYFFFLHFISIFNLVIFLSFDIYLYLKRIDFLFNFCNNFLRLTILVFNLLFLIINLEIHFIQLIFKQFYLFIVFLLVLIIF
jgi:hypothetical protein